VQCTILPAIASVAQTVPAAELERVILPAKAAHQRPTTHQLVLAFLAVFVITSCAMTHPPASSVRSELAPTARLRVGINTGNFLLVTNYVPGTEPRGVGG
jgi:hypothetical protein